MILALEMEPKSLASISSASEVSFVGIGVDSKSESGGLEVRGFGFHASGSDGRSKPGV